MARRRPNDEEGVNMDTMMDNMTDVVGTLLMIMIVVQIQVADRAGQIEEELAKVTPQQVQQAKQQLEATKTIAQKAGANQEVMKQNAKSKLDDLRAFESAMEQKGVKLRDSESLQKDLLAKREAEKAEKQAVTSLLTERDNLRATLDKTPMPKGPPPVDVRVPVAKAVPPDAVMYRVLCLSNKVYMIGRVADPKFGWSARVWTELEKEKNALRHDKPHPDGKTFVFDHFNTINWLTAKKYADEYVALTFPLNTNSMTDRVTMQIIPRADGGETPEQVDDPDSNFRKTLVKLRQIPKAVCWFWIHPTGVAAYHASREQCSRYGIPAGWEFYTGTRYEENLPQFVVNRFKELPPPPPPPKPAGPSQINIAAPKKTLD